MSERLPPDPRMIALPATLSAAIEQALRAVPEARWLHAARALSERYRGPRGDAAEPLASGHHEALGYAALIMPATYAQLHGASAAAALRTPEWQPETMLDLGSGAGAALWAAIERWPSLRDLTAWEREPALLALGQTLAQAGEHPALRQSRWIQRDIRKLSDADGAFDLVVIGHVLNELAVTDREQVLDAAWRVTRGMLLIVEPGTNAGFAVVRAARDRLLAAGAATIAPCAHNRACPLHNDWCHFPQRLRRPEFQRRARGAPSPWEDTKYSYAVLARFAPAAPIWGRVIAEPSFNKAYAEARISTEAGVIRRRALKRDRDAFRRIKELAWGAALTEEP